MELREYFLHSLILARWTLGVRGRGGCGVPLTPPHSVLWMALDLAKTAGSVLLFQALFWLSHLFCSHPLSPVAYKYTKLSAADRNVWCQFVCSFVKGVAVCCLCYPVAWRNAEALRMTDSFDGVLDKSEMQLPLYLFMGYAISDTVSIASYFQRGKGDTALIIHHLATASIWCYILALDFAYNLACIACLVEFTTPLLAVRWFMASSRLKTHPLYVFNGLMILVGWWVLRIGLYVGFFSWRLQYLVARGLSSREGPVLLAWLVGAVLQVFWGQKLTVGFIKVVKTALKKTD